MSSHPLDEFAMEPYIGQMIQRFKDTIDEAITADLVARGWTPPPPGVPRMLSVPSEESMFALLSGLNISGVTPEVACSMPAIFLATLTDPDADHVHYVHTDEGGYVHCCGCSDHYPRDCDEAAWKPVYPVLALLPGWPDIERCVTDEIDAWWIAPRGGA